MMDEVYTCTCGGQSFSIHEGHICCVQCSVEYNLRRFKALSGALAQVLENPKDFNERIRKSLLKDLVNKKEA